LQVGLSIYKDVNYTLRSDCFLSNKTGMKKILVTAVLVLVSFGPLIGFAQETGVVVLSDTVTGNQEQPKVLYIVPWQAADDNTILYQPLSTRLQRDVFKHVERPEHLRELKFLQQLQEGSSELTGD